MTIVDSINVLAEWLEREVCAKIEMKVPSNTKQTAKYDYQLANPTVHKMYAPPQSLVNQANNDLCPGILVHLLDGEDRPRETARTLKFRLLLGVWNPGPHRGDYLIGKEHAADFVPDAEGWNDLWNLFDLLLRELKNAEHIGGALRVKAEDGFRFSPYKEDGVIIDFYPFYFGVLEFSVACPQAPPTRYYIEEYL